MNSLNLEIDGQERKLCAWGGNISLTRRHYLNSQSVAWDYQTGDSLEVSGQVITRERAVLQSAYLSGKKKTILEYPFGINCWIYSENADGNKLKFSFGKDGTEKQSFVYTLNFTGWKEISVPYERGYMQGQFDTTINQFKITALSGSGTVFLEEISLCKAINPNHIYGKMAPQIEKFPLPTRRGAIAAVEQYGSVQGRPVFLTEKWKTEHVGAFAQMTEKYFELMDEIDLPPFQRGNIPYTQAMELFKEYDIVYQEGIVTGKRITNTSLYAKAMKSIAAHFYENRDAGSADCFILMWRHLMDQNATISWYHGRGVGSGMLMMKEELAKRGLLEEAVSYLKEAYDFSRIYATATQGIYTHARFEDTDSIGMDLPSTLACILLMQDSPEKVQDMRHFVYYVENFCLGIAPGLTSGYKPDGTASHHCGYIRQYETVANYSLSRVLYIMSGTMFMIGEEAAQRFKKILRTAFLIYNGVYEPFAMAQYAFDKMRDTSVVEFAHAANALHDKMLAQMYVTLAECSEKERKNPNYPKFLEQGIEPVREMTAHKTLTYAAAAFHKRKNWTMALRGHSKYVYPMEIWPDETGPESRPGARYTAFSLFRSFGFLEILYPPVLEGGTNNGLHIEKGFDYRRWPGSTAVHVPLRSIKSVPLMVEDEWAEWLLSDQGFVGGLDGADENGIFVMQLHGPEKYGLESFYATKTYHFYEDMVLCLGSNISNELSAYKTETTLFQDYGTGAERRNNILMDNRGNGYWVFPEYEIEFYTAENRSRDIKDREDTVGERTFGIISHGEAPQNAKYGYLLKIGTTMEEMEQLNVSEDIRILQQDETAHIVRILDKTNYVFFKKCYEMTDRWIENVSGSCIVSVSDDGELVSLSVCDPDLRFYLGESEDYDINRHKQEKSVYGRFWTGQESISSRIWITLNLEMNHLEIIRGNAKVIQRGDGKTILEFICKDGMTNEIQIYESR